MHRIWLVLLLGALCLGILGISSNKQVDAAYATTTNPGSSDPYHHLSGILAIPPSRLLAGAGMGTGGTGTGTKGSSNGMTRRWAGPLTPPVFGPNVDASLNNSSAQNETTASIDPDNNQVIIASANDYRCNLCPQVYRSTDGGTNWVNYPVPGVGSLYYGDPAMAFDHNNYTYFSYLGYTGALCSASGGMYISRSTDAGTAFSTPIQLASNSVGTSIAILQDKEYVAVDSNPTSPYSGNVYVGWTQYAFQVGAGCGSSSSQLAAPAVFTRSTDHGISWTAPITASQPISNNNSGVLPVIGRHGEVYLYYVGAATQQQTNYDSVLFSRSTDGGQTFPLFTHISSLVDLPSPLPPTSFRNNPFGAMAADQQVDGYLYAVWADYRTGDADILLSRSTDNGNTWGAPIRVNDDPLANGKDQFFPWIASSPDGYVHIGWFDRREDSTNHNYKEYFTHSSDHGATWAPNVAVSTAPSVPGNSNFIGDYSGLAASTGVVMPIWTDIRSGTNQNAYVARGVYTPEPPTTGTATGTPPASPTSTPTRTSTVPTATATPFTPGPTNTSGGCIGNGRIPVTCTRTPSATSTGPTGTPTDSGGCLGHGRIPCSPTVSATSIRPTGTPTVTSTFTPGTILTGTPTTGPTSTACPLQFTDVPNGSTFYPYIRCLACRGIVSGYQDGTFRPNNNVTRGQLSKIVSNSAGFADPQPNQQFEDVPAGSTFQVYIGRLYSRGIIGGYPCGGPFEPCGPGNLPYFRPNANATRGQITKIDANAAGYNDPPVGQQFEDVPVGSTFYTYTYQLVTRGIMSGYPCGGPGEPCVPPGNLPYFRPNNNATRGQTSKIVANTFFPGCQTPSSIAR